MPGTIMITGATGFIGSHVARHAARLLPDRELRLMVHRKALVPPASPHVETVPGDLADPRSLRGVCAGVDVLVHCASQIGGPAESCQAVNAHGTEALVAEARRSGVRRIVYVSTAAVYGRGPFRGERAEDLPLAPASATSRSRAAAEQAVLAADGIVLRPHMVYGAGDRWVAPGLRGLMTALGSTVDGWRCHLSLIDVDDLAQAVLATALAPREDLTASVYHANHPRPVLVADLLRALGEVYGLPWPTVDRDYATARAHLQAQGRTSHDLDMVTVDHWFDSDPLWTALRRAPGPGFANRFPPHTTWYRDASQAA
ncbi:NAD-dependent epimerase/dehydratase family protein [Streptomyces sp. RPT161]|uniref:NAD-dependent epimerase/dehydratase family protein n=1 Tax=Streptomyces sp. RPT161 TaxID=3015993 RepID=UPI0022B8C0CE|nr:NAD-dependent epimerase/dehydratase family protein [Streptomyces sp. RPT161]